VEAFCNADVPLPQLIADLKPARVPGHHPLFQVTFASVQSAFQTGNFGPLRASPYVLPRTKMPYNLALTLVENGDAYTLEMEYRKALFVHEQIFGRLHEYVAILEAIVAAPNAPLSEVAVTSARVGS